MNDKLQKIRRELYRLLYMKYTRKTIDEVMDTLEKIAEVTLKG